MPSYKLYTPEASFRAFSILIAAEYNGIPVEVVTDNASAVASTKSPVGKLPLLEITSATASNTIFSSHAAARYMSQLRSDNALLGSTIYESAAIDSWMDWCAQELELPACVWFYPIAGYMPYNATAYVSIESVLLMGG